jgi:proline iminopeptidase
MPTTLDISPSATLPAESGRAVSRLEPVWRRPWAGASVAAGSAGCWGLLAGWWMPRGPLTSSHALWSIGISVVVGVIAGVVTRSRWAMLAAPAAFAATFELVRMGTDGPTVDGIHLSTYGLLAFAVGRGFHALVALGPLVWGAAVGAGVGRRLTTTSAGQSPADGPDAPQEPAGTPPGFWPRARRAVAVIAAVGLVVFSIGLARPARTAQIVGADGQRVAGSIAELTTVKVAGNDLRLMVRGRDVDAPVLLFLAGGPGGSELGAMRRHLPELEEHFVVVTWDQRGTGASYSTLDPTSTYTLASALDDTLAVTNHLRERFGQDEIYLMGQSWGTLLGVLATQRQPELYRAFIGTGQMVSPAATDRIFYDDTLQWARDEGRDGLVAELLSIGPPPYDDMLDYETALSYEHQVYPYDRSPNAEGQGGFSENFLVEEYSLIDKVHLLGAFMDTFSVLYPQIQGIDFRDDVPSIDVPVFFVQGAHEAAGRSEPFEEWFRLLDAPVKERIVLATSGHRPLFEQPDEFVDVMADVVLARTADPD